MKKWEEKHKYKLLFSKQDFNIHKSNKLSTVFEKGEVVKGKVVLPGWLKNEVIITSKNRLITVFNSKKNKGDAVKAKIVKIKHNLYLAEEKR